MGVQFLVLIFIIVAIYMVWLYFSSRFLDEPWQEVADRLGLQFQEGEAFEYCTLSGEHRFVSLNASIHTEWNSPRRRKRRILFTEFNADIVGPWDDVQVTLRGIGDQLIEMVGGEDIKLGHSGFDNKFRVRGTLPQSIRMALVDDQVRPYLFALAHGCDQFKIQDNVLQVRIRDTIKDVETMIARIEKLTRAAAAINGKFAQFDCDESSSMAAPERGLPTPDDDPRAVDNESPPEWQTDNRDEYSNVSW